MASRAHAIHTARCHLSLLSLPLLLWCQGDSLAQFTDSVAKEEEAEFSLVGVAKKAPMTASQLEASAQQFSRHMERLTTPVCVVDLLHVWMRYAHDRVWRRFSRSRLVRQRLTSMCASVSDSGGIIPPRWCSGCSW